MYMVNNNLLPAKKKNGFLNKIKQIFRSIIYKESKSVQQDETTIEQTNNENIQPSFIENLKEETDIETVSAKEALQSTIEAIEENPQILDNLNVEELEEINNYYIDKIAETDKKINKLKKTN